MPVGRPKGYIVTPQTKEKIRASMLGQKYSPERCMAIGLAKRGKPAWNKGSGNRTKLTQMIRSSAQYFDWRRKVFNRDGFKCIFCEQKGGWNKEIKKRIVLNVDHISAFSIILTEHGIQSLEEAINCQAFWDIDNGRTLCTDCHKKTDNFGNKALRRLEK